MKKELVHSTYFVCGCLPEVEMNGVELKQHLKDKHGLNQIKGTKKLSSALDMGGSQYINTYELEIEGMNGTPVTKVSKGIRQ